MDAPQRNGINRPSVEYSPSVWGDYFITNPTLHSTHKESAEWIKQRVEKLIVKVKEMLNYASEPLDKMHMIDALQRLGVDYHFEKEIDMELSQIHEAPCEYEDLHATALQFRLLRQHRYNVSTDAFTKFRDEQGKFKAILTNDIKGLLSLYEAAYLGTPQEEILNEAIGFSKCHLKSIIDYLEPPLSTSVLHALETPLQRRMRRLEARLYISIYQEDMEACNDVILELAKLDFHLLQLLHRDEIRTISTWWKELQHITKLTFARDRIVEGYFWMLGVYFEPHHARARMMMTKLAAFLSLTDDIFDSYGTVKELIQLNNVIQRWDEKNVDQVEGYLQPYVVAMFSTIKEFEGILASEGMSYNLHYLKELIKDVFDAYLKEAKLKAGEYVLPIEEQLQITLRTTGYHLLAYASFIGMGEEAKKEVFKSMITFPKIIKALTTICRFIDDIADYELDKDEFITSNVKSYMEEHGTTAEEACMNLLEMVEVEWKVLNQESINLTMLPTSLVIRIINLARVMEIVYKKADGYNQSIFLKDYITLLLVEPIQF